MSGFLVADAIEVHDERFLDCVDADALLVTVFTGCRFAEGPVHLPAERALLWSDVPGNRVLRLDEETSQVTVAEHPADFPNGQTRDAAGRIVRCEHGTRRVVRIERDGSRTVLADRVDGKRLNSPNDVVVAKDGGVWFTDPTYGIDGHEEGYPAISEIGENRLYRIDPATLACEVRADGFRQPNGLAFSPDGGILYVVDSGYTHDQASPRHVRRFTVEGTRLHGGEVLAECDSGVFDGVRVDDDGRLWLAAGDGVRCHLPDGTHLGTIVVPEEVGNLEFGGPTGSTLYICATTTLRRMPLRVRGAVSSEWTAA